MGAKKFDRRLFRNAEKLLAFLIFNVAGDIPDIISRIPVLGEIDLFSKKLAIPSIERQPKILHLLARVVDVVLAFDREPCGLVQARQDITDDRNPPVSYVQWAGWVDAGKLDLNFLTAPKIHLVFFSLG